MSNETRRGVKRLVGLPLILITLLAAADRATAQDQPAASPDASVETADVTLDGATLFRVRGVSSLPAAARARLIREHLVTVATDAAIPVNAIHSVEGGEITRIVAGSVTIMTLVEADATLEQVRRVELAAVHLARLRQAVADYREARSPGALRRAAVVAVATTAALIAGIAVLVWLMRRLNRRLEHLLQTRIKSVEIQSHELMRAEHVWRAISSAFFGLRTALFLVMVLAWLNFVLARFPWTRELSHKLVMFELEPLRVMANGIVTHVPGLIFLIVLFVIIRAMLRLVRLFFDAVGRGTIALANFDPDWAEPTGNLVRLAIVALALVVAYPYIPGSGTAAFQGVSLFLGILLSLGSSSAISNTTAGYMMIYRRALKVGDRVKIGNTMGDVIQTRLQVTHLRSFKNEEIIIPNSQIMISEVINYSTLSRDRGLILYTEVGIGYETPWRQVEAMLLAAADRTEGVLKEPRPFVSLKKLGDFAVTYELNVHTHHVTAMRAVYTQLHHHILDEFNDHGVQIMTPAYESDPDQPKVVPKNDWYAAPALETDSQPPGADRARGAA